MTSRRVTASVPLLLCLAVAAGCSTSAEDATTTALRGELDEARTQQQQLEERVGELEEALAPTEGATEDPLAALDARLDDLDDALAQLAAAVEAESQARAGAVSAVDDEVAGIDQRLADLQAVVVELRGAVQELTDEVSSLEAQFKTHRGDDTRHR